MTFCCGLSVALGVEMESSAFMFLKIIVFLEGHTKLKKMDGRALEGFVAQSNN
ncbi:MAG: hypothetical protein ACXVI7_04175 [Halobacteriota archaeon]